jgi:hypothetical protein
MRDSLNTTRFLLIWLLSTNYLFFGTRSYLITFLGKTVEKRKKLS